MSATVCVQTVQYEVQKIFQRFGDLEGSLRRGGMGIQYCEVSVMDRVCVDSLVDFDFRLFQINVAYS